MVCSIDFEVFRVWSWLFDFERWPWVKNTSTIRKPIDICYNVRKLYLTSIDTSSLYSYQFSKYLTWNTRISKEVIFEKISTAWNSIWNFLSISYSFWDIWLQNSKVWLWPCTFRGHLKLNFVYRLTFESSYLTFYWHLLLYSPTVFEIYDLKLYKVWPCPLIPWRSFERIKSVLLESPYRTSYLTSIDTTSLYSTVFEIFPYLVPFLIYLTSNFLWSDLDLWP